MVTFDVVQRWLRSSGYQVIYVRNITDIDDKIINRANENGESFDALTERIRASSLSLEEAGAQTLGRIASTLAHGEGLPAHARSAEFRLDS